jgi:hypothetical protein
LKIARLTSQNLRAAPDAAFLFGADEAAPSPLVVVTGPAGSGKTLFLETIVAAKEAAAPYGVTPAAAPLIRFGAGSAKVTIDWWLDDAEAAFAGVTVPFQPCEVVFHKKKLPESDADPGLLAVLGRYEHNPAIGKVDYFSTSRRFEVDSLFGGSLAAEQRYMRLSREPRKYRGILKFVRELMFGGHRDVLDRFGALFKALAPSFRFAGLDTVGLLEFVLPSGERAGFEALSASAHQALVFAGSVLMTELHNSVVLIDTPELYLGPGEAARFLSVLMDFAPTNQWIVATQDPALVAMAKKEATISLAAWENRA